MHSACAAPQDVEDGKLRLIPTRSREGEGLTVYEPAARMMYALPALTDREQAALAAGSAQAGAAAGEVSAGGGYAAASGARSVGASVG